MLQRRTARRPRCGCHSLTNTPRVPTRGKARAVPCMQGVRWRCSDGQHNDLATGFWSSPDELISRLFSVGHSAETSGEVTLDSTGFSQTGLLLYSAVYLTMLALCAGICVPAGMFMPAIVLGAATGLAAGVSLQESFPEMHIQPGTAPLSAAAVASRRLLPCRRCCYPSHCATAHMDQRHECFCASLPALHDSLDSCSLVRRGRSCCIALSWLCVPQPRAPCMRVSGCRHGSGLSPHPVLRGPARLAATTTLMKVPRCAASKRLPRWSAPRTTTTHAQRSCPSMAQAPTTGA